MSDLIKTLKDNVSLGKSITFRAYGMHLVIEVKDRDLDEDLNNNCQLLPMDDHFYETVIVEAIRFLSLKNDGFNP